MWISRVRFAQLEAAEKEAGRLAQKAHDLEHSQHGQEITWARKEAELTATAHQAVALGAEKTREIGMLRRQVAELTEERKLHLDWIIKGTTGVPMYHPDPPPVTPLTPPVPEAADLPVLTTLQEAIQAVGLNPRKIAKWVENRKQMDFDLARAGLARENDEAKAHVAKVFEQDEVDAKVEAQLSK